jgi:integrase/recombinase XerC
VDGTQSGDTRPDIATRRATHAASAGPTPPVGVLSATVTPLHGGPSGDVTADAHQALARAHRYLDRCKLAANTVRAYRRQGAAYVTWLEEHADDHGDAFADVVGAEAAVTAWRRHLVHEQKASPSTINQALAAITLLYEHHAGLRIHIKRARVPRPGQPDALTPKQQSRVERAADRRGTRDAAIVAVLLYTGARVEECAALDALDIAITARTGEMVLRGKGDEVRTVPIPAPARQRLTAWLNGRGTGPGPLWTGQRGPLTASGITQAVLAIGEDAGIHGLRPHRLRHSYGTRLQARGIASDASFGRFGDRDPVRDLGFRTGRPARWRRGRHAL